MFLIGIFSSLDVSSHHIYGSRIDYSFISTRIGGLISVMDIMGKTYSQFTANEENTLLDIQNYPNGLYIVKIQKEGIENYHKIVVNR